MTLFGVPAQALFGQLLIGLINGSFYALLSLGLSVIFGLLNIINFAHGALYMMGAFVAYFLLQYGGLGYWWALVLAPVIVGLVGIVIERTTLKNLYHLDHLYGLLLTFGLGLIIEGLFRQQYGSSGLPYANPIPGGINLRTTGLKERDNLPRAFQLFQNYPNPFNPQTRIDFYLQASGKISLTVYDVLGRSVRELANGFLLAGAHSVVWDGRDGNGRPVGSGMYFYQMVSSERREIKKMILVK